MEIRVAFRDVLLNKERIFMKLNLSFFIAVGCTFAYQTQAGDTDWREYAFSEIGSSTQNSVITVRGRTEKYVLFRKNGTVEYEQFFNLENDPWETTNLAENKKYAADVLRMKSVLKKWEEETEVSEPFKAVGILNE
jgi:hypothetical protein